MTVDVPLTLTDGQGFVWDIQPDGRIGNGSADAFDAGLDNVDMLAVSNAEEELSGRQVLLTSSAVSNPEISLERRIYVPEDQPWARFIDTATNTSDQTVTYTFRLSTNFGSDTLTQIVATSSGDQTLGGEDTYFINDDANSTGGDPQVTIAFGDGTLAASSAGYSSTDIAEQTFTVTLDPGEAVSIMSFAAQSQDPSALAALAEILGGSATAAMQAGIPHWLADTVANYDVDGFFEQTDYYGNAFSDTFLGTDRDENFYADAGADVVLAGAGRDFVDAGYGQDVVTTGAGADTVWGGGGADVVQGDAGQDVLLGDGGNAIIGVANTTIAETGDALGLQIRLPDANDTGSAWIEGTISRQALGADGLNTVYVLDMSGSMIVEDAAQSVGDLNGDGRDNRLIDIAIAGFETLSRTYAEAGLAASDITIVAFDDEAVITYQGALGAAVSDNFTGLVPAGDTSYEAALATAAQALTDMGAGTNQVVFVSDGAPTDGAVYTDEVSILTDPDGLNATIHAVGIGSGVSLFHLDLVDDGTLNNSATQMTSPQDLVDAVLGTAVGATELAEARIYVNDSLQMTLDPSGFEVTPLGLYFSADVAGLLAGEDDQITVDLVASDSAQTTLTVALTLLDGAAGEGGDTLYGGADMDVLQGDAGDDFLLGDAAADTLAGGLGQDRLLGGGGHDLLMGGAGNDHLHGGAGADTLIGGAGADIISYSGSTTGVVIDLALQTVSGGDADGDVISGITGAEGTHEIDGFVGTDGANYFRPGKGNDVILAGGDVDTVDYSDIDGAVYVRLQDQGDFQDSWAAGFDFLEDVDALIGSQFDDYLIGDSSYNELTGGAGDDVIKSKGGNDRLDGGDGDDRIDGDAGNEWIHGGAGNDDLKGLGGDDTIHAGTGDDYVAAGRDDDLVYGHGGADSLRGNNGSDTIYGGRGWDDIRGGGGGDYLDGENGEDYMLGENGNDTLFGGSGDDVLLGGGGADQFLFRPGMDFDEVRDFEIGADRLDVTAFGFSDYAALLAMAEDRSSGLRFNFGDGDVGFVIGLSLAELLEGDVVL